MMKKFFKIFYKCIIWIISIILLLVASYLLVAVILSVIPVNCHTDSKHEIEIYIQSNGVHLDMVLPLRNEIKDWTTEVWIDNRITHLANFISFGWGDKRFFSETPEWSDLKIKTAVNALFFNNPSAIHIDYYKDIQTSEKCKMIPVSKEQYKFVVNYIEKSFKRDSFGKIIRIQGLKYNSFDCFYEATDSYNMFFTCNTWTNKCLKESGLKACLWTPFDKGTFYQYRKMNRNNRK